MYKTVYTTRIKHQKNEQGDEETIKTESKIILTSYYTHPMRNSLSVMNNFHSKTHEKNEYKVRTYMPLK